MEEKLCPACGEGLTLLEPGVTLGVDGNSNNLLGVFATASLPHVQVDFYICPKCGKLELYKSNFQPPKPEEEEEEPLYYDSEVDLQRAKLARQLQKESQPPAKDAPAGDPWDKKEKSGGLFGIFRSDD